MKIREKRMALGITQKKMSELVGVRQPSYWAYEKGITMPRPAHAKKIAEILDLTLDEIYRQGKHNGQTING